MEIKWFSTPRQMFAVVILLYVGAFLPTLSTPYLMDDSHTIQQNQYVHSLAYVSFAWTSAKAYSSTPDNYGYRPLTVNFNQLVWFLGGGSAKAFQIAKKLILFGLALLVTLVWLKWESQFAASTTPQIFMTFSVFALVLIHPFVAHTANYIAASSTLISAFFYFLALFWYFKMRDNLSQNATPRSPSRRRAAMMLLAACVSYFLAIMAKEEGITAVAIIALIEIFYFRKWMGSESSRGVRGLLNRFSGTLAFALTAALGATLIVVHFEPTSNIARELVSRSQYFSTQWLAYVHYLKLVLWPVGFNFDNLSFGFNSQVWTTDSIAALSIHSLALLFGLFLCIRQNRYGLVVLAFYISIAPASSIIPLAEAVNDHRAFIPFLFLVYPLSNGVAALTGRIARKASNGVLRPHYATVVLTIVFVALASTTFARNLDFSSAKTIWIDTVLRNPLSARAKNNLALEYMTEGNHAVAKSLLHQCIVDKPSYAVCHTNLGVVLALLGDDALAEKHFQQALTLDRGIVNSRLYYFEFLAKRGRFEEGRKLLEEADRFAEGHNAAVKRGLEFLTDPLRRLPTNTSGPFPETGGHSK